MMRTKNLKWWKKNQKLIKKQPAACVLRLALFVYIYLYVSLYYIRRTACAIQHVCLLYSIRLSSSEDSYWNPSSSFRLIAFYEHVSIFLAFPFDSRNNSEAWTIHIWRHQTISDISQQLFLPRFFFLSIHNYTEIEAWRQQWSYTPQLSKMKKKPSVRTLFGVNRFFKIFYILIFECLSLSSGREGLTNRSSTSGLLILYPLSLFFF